MAQQTIGDLQGVSDFEAVPLTTQSGEARQRLQAGTVLVVVDQQESPVGILTRDQSAALSDPAESLRAYQEHFVPPTLTTPATSLEDIQRGMAVDPSIRWHVLMQNDQIAGVVSPDHIFQKLRADAETEEDVAKSLGEMLPGNLVSPPPGLCYHCTGASGHTVSPLEVERRDVIGRALCPHDGSVMIAENPCQREEAE